MLQGRQAVTKRVRGGGGFRKRGSIEINDSNESWNMHRNVLKRITAHLEWALTLGWAQGMSTLLHCLQSQIVRGLTSPPASLSHLNRTVAST